MADLFARAMSKGDTYEEAAKACDWLKEGYPYLHDVLCGHKPSKDGVPRLPGSVRIFTNGGELKCEITGQEWLMRGYLVLPPGVLTIEAIEDQLKSGQIGWAVKTERKASY
jgi:hypothetical protein